MVGGKVIDIKQTADYLRLWCMDHRNGDECGVMIEVAEEVPVLGDDVWWHCGYVYWTPADRRFIDRKLRKIGYSSSGDHMLAGVPQTS